MLDLKSVELLDDVRSLGQECELVELQMLFTTRVLGRPVPAY